MRHVTCLFLGLAVFPSALHAGEIYGSITEGGKAVAKSPIEIRCKNQEPAKGDTGADGSYRINVSALGQCTLELRRYSASAVVFSYKASSQYKFEVVKADGRYQLRRR